MHKNELFSDQENNVINRLREGLDSIERDKRAQHRDSEVEAAESMRHQLAEMLGRDLSTIPGFILEGMSGILSNWDAVRSNPLAIQDLRARVEGDIATFEAQEAERRGVVYTMARLVRADGSATQHKVASSHSRSDLPNELTYAVLPPVHVTKLKKVEMTSQSGFAGEREATKLLQNAEAHKVLFDDAEVRGERVADAAQVWDKLGYDYTLRPRGYAVIAIRRASGDIVSPKIVKLDDLHTNTSTRVFNCVAKVGDSVVFSTELYEDHNDAKYMVAAEKVRYVKRVKTMLP